MTRNGLIDIERPPVDERAVLVRLALPTDTPEEIDESMAELTRLAETAGATVVARFVQRRPTPCPGTYIGEGKVQEIRAAAEGLEADLVIVDGDLSPRQGSKLEKLLDRKVVDRTQLILDIFAQHAHTNEGKLQVELAQLQYILPRLAGRGSIMRQQGGIGVRGPGEQKLEVDRRVIRNRIARLQQEIETIRKTRRVQRKRRTEAAQGTVALVGYTNAGKSSLLNALTDSGVYVANKLFATLDPRSRRCMLPSRREIVLTDTVGFIRKLPHSLVAAFRATLEEVTEADLLLVVADVAHPATFEHLEAVNDVLEEIGIVDSPRLIVFNKVDIATEDDVAAASARYPGARFVSAHTGDGLEALLERIDDILASTRHRVRLRIPQEEAGLLHRIHAGGRILDQHYEDNAIVIEAEIDKALENRLADYVA